MLRTAPWITGLVLLLSVGFIERSAFAVGTCGTIIQCGSGLDYFTIDALPASSRTPQWILKNCKCIWRGGSSHGAARGSGATTVLQADALPPADHVQQPIARDPKGKLGPTPAPLADVTMDAAESPFATDLSGAASRYKLPVHLLRAVMHVESGGNPMAQSNKGAVGLMQLLPVTATALGVDDIHDTAQNIMGGARFLRILANRFDGDLVKVLSAYHAGSMRVQGRDATPFAATDDYVRKVLRLYYQYRDQTARRG